MKRIARTFFRAGSALAPAVLLFLASSTLAPAGGPPVPAAGRDPAGLRPRAQNQYVVVPLVSDGFIQAPGGDRNLVNPWGLAVSGTGLWWVGNNGSDSASIFNGEGVAQPLVVFLPGGAAPTGVAFYSGLNFILSDGTSEGPARFLFAGEHGGIFGWGPAVSRPGPTASALLALDRGASGAIYKGLAVATTGAGDRLYVTDFHNRSVDVFDGAFQPVALAAGAFVDPGIPEEFAPFGIRNLQGRIFVTYAKRDPAGEDDVTGPGLGFVSVFDTDGAFLARIGTHGPLNAPWGMALAPAGFGRFGGDLLVGNFGDGRIVAYRISDDLRRAVPDGVLRGSDRRPVVVDGLWAIQFGNGALAAPIDTLFFTAGPGDERHGLFGRIESR
jgi:uncharacterized protein (TIGR03118 family)